MILIKNPSRIILSDALGMYLSKSESQSKQDKFRYVPKNVAERMRKLKQAKGKDRLQDMSKIRTKAHSTNANHIAMVAPFLLDGTICPPMVIFKAAKMKPEWDASDDPDWTWEVNGTLVKALWVCSLHGGMTEELWGRYHSEIILPIMNGFNPEGESAVHIYDGDFSHMSSKVWEEMAESNVIGMGPPPHTSSFTQAHDTGKAFANWQRSGWPTAKRSFARELKRTFGKARPLENMGVSKIMKHDNAFKATFKKSTLTQSVSDAGLNPCNRAPLFLPEIIQTKEIGVERPDKCKKCIDLVQIRYAYDQAELLADSVLSDDEKTETQKMAAAEELAKQLGGSRWSAAKFWRYAHTEDNMVFVQKIYEYDVVKKKKKLQRQESAYRTSAKNAASAKKLKQEMEEACPFACKQLVNNKRCG